VISLILVGGSLFTREDGIHILMCNHPPKRLFCKKQEPSMHREDWWNVVCVLSIYKQNGTVVTPPYHTYSEKRIQEDKKLSASG